MSLVFSRLAKTNFVFKHCSSLSFCSIKIAALRENEGIAREGNDLVNRLIRR